MVQGLRINEKFLSIFRFYSKEMSDRIEICLSIDRHKFMIWCIMFVFKHVFYMSVLRQIRDKATCQFIILSDLFITNSVEF